MGLPNTFWMFPSTASTTMRRKEVQEVLLVHDGKIIACGRLWDIKSKSIGPGVYRVYLKEVGDE